MRNTTVRFPTSRSLWFYRTNSRYIPFSTHDLIDLSANHRIDSFQQFAVPFDTYFLNTLVFVVEKATNKFVLITRLRLVNSFTSPVDMKTKSNYTYNSGTGTTTVGAKSRSLQVIVECSVIMRALAMCMLLAKWPLAPVTVILTVPAIRVFCVGSPRSGIYIDGS